MSMNFKFSWSCGESQAVPPVGVCCYSNTNSTVVLLEQQGAAAGITDYAPGDTGGL
jgi:hypothetical protein